MGSARDRETRTERERERVRERDVGGEIEPQRHGTEKDRNSERKE